MDHEYPGEMGTNPSPSGTSAEDAHLPSLSAWWTKPTATMTDPTEPVPTPAPEPEPAPAAPSSEPPTVPFTAWPTPPTVTEPVREAPAPRRSIRAALIGGLIGALVAGGVSGGVVAAVEHHNDTKSVATVPALTGSDRQSTVLSKPGD
ncbi:MAG TPA: hypothetical protein VFR41_09675, partial [Acidimicrobiia bacterium]|nr:hypothetical protein [Acidimicrobiia bacterium]